MSASEQEAKQKQAIFAKGNSIVYTYKDGKIGNDIIEVPARRGFVLVREDGTVHAFPGNDDIRGF